ncbi:MAG: hypothetical protein GF331_10180 [Chitinivibrionales bacterium]|nr:hypothetical protein [Chitinivibrionales bacterium]
MKRCVLSVLTLSILALVSGCSRGPDDIAGGTTGTDNAKITCVVVDASGAGAADVPVTLYDSRYLIPVAGLAASDSSAVLTTRTDSAGAFVFDSLPSGSYSIVADDGAGEAVRITVDVDTAGEYELGEHMLASHGSVHGSIGQPGMAASYHVRVYGLHKQSGVDPLTGQFSIDAMPAGTYVLRVDATSDTVLPVELPAVDVTAGEQTLVDTVLVDNVLRVRVDTRAAGVVDTVTDYPLAVRFDPSALGIDALQAHQGQVSVLTPAGSALPYEVELWEPSSSGALLWVLVDTVTGADTTRELVLTIDDTAPAGPSSGERVFGASYDGVWHLGDDRSGTVGDTAFLDASGKGNRAIDSVYTASVSTMLGVAQQFAYVGAGDSSDAIVVPDRADSVLEGVGDFAVSCWFQTSEPGQRHTVPILMHKGDSSQAGYHLYFTYNTTAQRWQLAFKDHAAGDNAAPTATAPAPVADDRWHYAVGQRRAGVLELYVDGVLAASRAANAGDVTNASDLYIGSKQWQRFHGSIDECRFAPHALSAATILLDYQTQRPDSSIVLVD